MLALNYWEACRDLRAVGAEVRFLDRPMHLPYDGERQVTVPLAYFVARPQRTNLQIIEEACNSGFGYLRSRGTDPVRSLNEFNDDTSHCEADHDYPNPEMLGHLTTD